MSPCESATIQRQHREVVTIKFISLNESKPEVLEEVVIVDRDDPVVEEIAGRYASRGMFPFDKGLRSLAPPQCLAAALEDDGHAIILIPEGADLAKVESLLRRSGLKRVASEELISNRPRKFLIV
jgi:hypothetical protein